MYDEVLKIVLKKQSILSGRDTKCSWKKISIISALNSRDKWNVYGWTKQLRQNRITSACMYYLCLPPSKKQVSLNLTWLAARLYHGFGNIIQCDSERLSKVSKTVEIIFSKIDIKWCLVMAIFQVKDFNFNNFFNTEKTYWLK